MLKLNKLAAFSSYIYLFFVFTFMYVNNALKKVCWTRAGITSFYILFYLLVKLRKHLDMNFTNMLFIVSCYKLSFYFFSCDAFLVHVYEFH